MRLIDNDGSITKTGAVQSLNGRSCFLVVAHLNEAKAFASPCIAISDNRGVGNGSSLFEQIEKIFFSRLIGESPYIKSHISMLLCRHL